MKHRTGLFNLAVLLLFFGGISVAALDSEPSLAQASQSSLYSMDSPTNTITVNSTRDVISPTDGDCTLREAVIAANTNTASGVAFGECPAGSFILKDIVQVPAGTYGLRISGTGENFALQGDLDVRQSLTIMRSTGSEVIIDAHEIDRVFDVFENTQLTLQGLTLKNGNMSTESGGAIRLASVSSSADISDSIFEDNETAYNGGAIYTYNAATFSVSDTIFRGNSAVAAGEGGAIFNNGAGSRIERCLFQANNASAGGAIENYGNLTVVNSTFSANFASNNGGAIRNNGTLQLEYNTIAHNTSPGAALFFIPESNTTLYGNILAYNYDSPVVEMNCYSTGAMLLGTYNFETSNTCPFSNPINYPNTEPLLGPLGKYGGFSLTYPLLPGSPAIDTNAVYYPTQDQRNVTRPLDGNNDSIALPDSGAFEKDRDIRLIFLPLVTKNP